MFIIERQGISKLKIMGDSLFPVNPRYGKMKISTCISFLWDGGSILEKHDDFFSTASILREKKQISFVHSKSDLLI